MAADLRERVARAVAYQAWKDETFWEMYLPESDAVLAELGLTQAEPLGEWEVYDGNSVTRFECEKDARDYARMMGMGVRFRVAAPQPPEVVEALEKLSVTVELVEKYDLSKDVPWPVAELVREARAALAAIKGEKL